MRQKLYDLLDTIDVDWVEENPDVAYELIEGLIKELYHHKDVIETQRESLLLAKAMIASNGVEVER